MSIVDMEEGCLWWTLGGGDVYGGHWEEMCI